MTRETKLMLGTLLLWLIPLPIILLGIGFSSGNIIDPAEMWRNLVSFDAGLLLQMFVWAYLLWPVFAIFTIVRRPKGLK